MLLQKFKKNKIVGNSIETDAERALKRGNYDVSISLLRIFATLAVIFIHTVCAFYLHPEIYHIDTPLALYYNRLSIIMCWAVPCFMMITGALLLRNSKIITFKDAILKYSRRIFLALIIFGIPFALMTIYFETHTLTIVSFGNAVLDVLQGKSWDHLWYLYVLIGAYLILPILKGFTDRCSQRELIYACLLLFFFGCIVPIINTAFNLDISFKIWLPIQPVFYLFAGHYLYKYPPKIKPIITSAIVIVALIIICAMDNLTETELHLALNQLLVIIISLGIFLIVTKLKPKLSHKRITLLWHLDRLCFAVYLIHPLFIHISYRLLNLTPVNFGDNSIFAILLFFFSFVVISFLAAWALWLIKPLKKYVL